MSKGILIINNPLTCAHCRFSISYENAKYEKNWACIITGDDVDLSFKSDNCPIIDVSEPIKELVYGISGDR